MPFGMFRGTRAASAPATPAPKQQPPRDAPSSAGTKVDKRVKSKKRWRLGISCDDKEFQDKASEFAAMLTGRHPRPLEEVLDMHFAPHEKALFLRASEDPELARLQRGYSRRYHRLLGTARFRNAKLATPTEAKVTKLTMLYFGLPVSPHHSMEVDREPPGDSEDEHVAATKDQGEVPGALRWLNAYTKRSYGEDLDRTPDAKYEILYSNTGAAAAGKTTRAADDSLWKYFQGDRNRKTSLRGGAGSADVLMSGTETVAAARPTGPFWRLHGQRGQVVCHDFPSFCHAVDRLLGRDRRHDYDFAVTVWDHTQKQVLGRWELRSGVPAEKDLFEQMRARDPLAERFSFYVRLQGGLDHKASEWVPDKNDSRVMLVRREGDTTGEVAYLYMPPFADRYFALNPVLGSRFFTAYVCDAVRLLMPDTPTADENFVNRIVQVRLGDVKANSVGGLNLTSDLLRALRGRAAGGSGSGAALEDLQISCPEPEDAAARSWRIHVPGLCVTDEYVGELCFNPRNVKRKLCQQLRRILKSLLGNAEYLKASHAEIWCPGEGIFRLGSWDTEKPYLFLLHDRDIEADDGLENSVIFTGHMQSDGVPNRALMAVRPVFKTYTVVMRNRQGQFVESEGRQFDLCGETSGTLSELRKLVNEMSQCPEDTGHQSVNLYISQLEPDVAESLHSGLGAAGARNPIFVPCQMEEADWIPLKRLIVSSTLFIQKITPLKIEEKQGDALFGFSFNMWNAHRDQKGPFPQVQRLGPALVGGGPRGSVKAIDWPEGTKSEAAGSTSRNAGQAPLASEQRLANQREPAFLGKPPASFTKYPLSQDEHDIETRRQALTLAFSVYDAAGPRIPAHGPTVETFLHAGPGVPSLSRGMLTATEQRRLCEDYAHMRSLALGRTQACPFEGCGRTFSLADAGAAAMRAHAEQEHLAERCNFCDERLYRYWDAEQRQLHFLERHADLFLSEEDLARDRAAAGPGGGGDAAAAATRCARREGAYNFCPRCGRSHRLLDLRQDRAHHDNNCYVGYASCPRGSRSYYCEDCGERKPEVTRPHDARECHDKDVRHINKAPYCVLCGLALGSFSGVYRAKHQLACKALEGRADAFCPWCGISAGEDRSKWAHHLSGCRQNVHNMEGPLDPDTGRQWDVELCPVEGCRRDLGDLNARGRWKHFEMSHAGVDGVVHDCPYCFDFSFSDLGWGGDLAGTQKKIDHIQEHLDAQDGWWSYDDPRGLLSNEMQEAAPEQPAAASRPPAAEARHESPAQERGRNKEMAGREVQVPPQIEVTAARADPVSPIDVAAPPPAKAVRGDDRDDRTNTGGRGRDGQATSATARAESTAGKSKVNSKASSSKANSKTTSKTSSKPASKTPSKTTSKSKGKTTSKSKGKSKEAAHISSSEYEDTDASSDDGPHPDYVDRDDGEYVPGGDSGDEHEAGDPASRTGDGGGKYPGGGAHRRGDPAYRPRKPSDWDDPKLISEAVYDPGVEATAPGEPGLPPIDGGGGGGVGAPGPVLKRKRPSAVGEAAAGSKAAGKAAGAEAKGARAVKKRRVVSIPAAKTPAASKAAAAAPKAAKKQPGSAAKSAAQQMLAAGTAPPLPMLGVRATRRSTRASSRAAGNAA